MQQAGNNTYDGSSQVFQLEQQPCKPSNRAPLKLQNYVSNAATQDGSTKKMVFQLIRSSSHKKKQKPYESGENLPHHASEYELASTYASSIGLQAVSDNQS
jgi:hypothetical protein